MVSKLIKILPVIYLLWIPFLSAKNLSADDSVTVNYNKWLKNIGLDKFFTASKIMLTSRGTGIAHVNIYNTYTLILRPSAAYSKSADMGKAWDYIRDGLQEKGIDISQLLLTKLADYSKRPLGRVKIELITNDIALLLNKPDAFSLFIYFDNEIVTKEKSSAVRGGDIAINFDFDGGAINAGLCGNYGLQKPFPDLRGSYNQWKAFFEGAKHKPGQAIKIESLTNESGIIELDITNMYGEITGEKYYEKIKLKVFIAPSKNQINYSATALYAPEGNKPPSEGFYHDLAAEPDFAINVLTYKNLLNEQFRKIYHVGP
jgi:hypothetical protein